MTPPRVFIVILQYNNSQDTIRCLNSVKELDYPNYEVIIIDNGSGVKRVDEIRNWIEKERKFASYTNTKYEILNTKYNLGYSGGNNIGIKHALKNGTDYVFILNPDTTIEKDALTKLVEAAESDPQIGILGPAIDESRTKQDAEHIHGFVRDEGGHTIFGGQIKWLKPELPHLVVEPLSILSGSTTKYYVPGTCMLIKRGVIEKNGLLDKRYFLYFEDADYCERTKRSSFKLAIVPEAVAHHKSSSSTSSLGAPLLLRYHYRNAHLFNWKNGSIWVKAVLPFWSIFIIIKQLAKIAMGREPKISKAILSGVGDFYRGRFGQIKIN